MIAVTLHTLQNPSKQTTSFPVLQAGSSITSVVYKVDNFVLETLSSSLVLTQYKIPLYFSILGYHNYFYMVYFGDKFSSSNHHYG